VSMTRHWLPCHDVPSDKATFDLTFEVPRQYTVAGTGVLLSREDRGDVVRFRWVENHQTATYLDTYSVGTYALVRDTVRGIPAEYYVAPADSVKARSYFTTVPAMIDAFTEYFGPYPFDKIGYCITPIGSMEHQTMVSLDASVFSSGSRAGEIVAHELAHQWWGDCVTPETFADAWVSEGFARYAESVYAGHMQGRKAYLSNIHADQRGYLNGDALNEGVFPLHDFPRTPPSSNYPGTIYNKGSAVLAMLRAVTGDSTFTQGLRTYRAANEYGSGSTLKLRAAMEQAAGFDLDWFFDEWVLQRGWPEYTVARISGAQDDSLRLRVVQTQETLGYPLFAMPVTMRIIRNAGDTLRPVIATAAVQTQDIVLPVTNADVKNWTFDADDIILKKLTVTTLGALPPPTAPSGLQMDASWPNPWSPARDGAVRASFRLAQPGEARLYLVDALGRAVRTTETAGLAAGRHMVSLEAGDIPPGAYTLLLHVGGEHVARRLIVLR
jgi:aminopeptidase N